MVRVQEGYKGNNSISTHTHLHNHKKSGFTLVELSIVIVIIGLVIGGVTTGMELVKQAQIRGLASQLRSYEAAFLSFRLQYNALPSDIRNASSYWSGSGNGNGNRIIDVGESVAFFGHLSKAKLLSADYQEGFPPGAPPYIVGGYNTPVSEYKKLLFIGQTGTISPNNIKLFNAQAPTATRNVYARMGNQHPGAWGVVEGFTTADAYAIDSKFDDGKPGTGIFLAGRSNSTACVDEAASAPGYGYQNLTSSSLYCEMYFLLGGG